MDQTAGRGGGGYTIKLSINHYTLIKYMLFHTYLDLLPLNLVYFVLENDNFVLEMSWKIILCWLWEPGRLFLWVVSLGVGASAICPGCDQSLG